jgi:hypothetical protein
MQLAEDMMKHPSRIAAGPRKRYLVVVVITLAPLIWNFAEHTADTNMSADTELRAGAPSAAPDHALLMASDVERALPVPPRAMPESLARTTL